MENDDFDEYFDKVDQLASSGGGRKVSCDDMSRLEFEAKENYESDDLELYHLKDRITYKVNS